MTQVLQSLLTASAMPLPCASPEIIMSSPCSASTASSVASNNEEIGEGGGDEVSVLDLLVDMLGKSLVSGCGASEITESWAMEIGSPINVRHVAHVTFDRFDGFLGLPDELQPEVSTRPPSASANVFGVSTESMQLSFDSRGNSVPTILLIMQQRLYELGGLQAKGIFRINAENGQEEHVRDQLNHGLIPDGVDVHCLAGLIKAWFRELPGGILDSFSPEDVLESQSEEQYMQLVRQLPPTEAALLDWALNLMADVAQMEHQNKMNAYNLAVVFAPNMTRMSDPLTALMHAVQLTNFLKVLTEKILQERLDLLNKAPHCLDPWDNHGHESPSISFREVANEQSVEGLFDASSHSRPAKTTSLTSIENYLSESPNSGLKAEAADDCHTGPTVKTRPKIPKPQITSRSSESYRKKGLKTVTERSSQSKVEKSNAINLSNSRPKKFEAWR